MKYVIEIDEIQEAERIKDCATLSALHSALKKKFGKKDGWEIGFGSSYVRIFSKSGTKTRTIFSAISKL